MSKTSEISVFCRRNDIQSYNNLNVTPLYSDLQFNNIVGQVIAGTNLTQYSEGNDLETYLSAILYFYLDNKETNQKDTITVVLNTYNGSTKSFINPGFFICQIIAGQGKYQGASGEAYIYVDEKLTRYFKIIVHY
jgi:hypothetical protein